MGSVSLFLVLVSIVVGSIAQYTADWASLDKRPLPVWYDQAKFGIFLHWSTFSVPSFKNEWYWYNLETKDPATVAFHDRVYGPNFTYPQFGPLFTAEMWNPEEWADIFVKSGAKYVVLTSKHHDGFCNWPSANSWNWNSKDTGPHQDNVGLLTAAVRSRNLTMGLYFSQFEWFNPLFLQDKANNGSTKYYQSTVSYPQMLDIVNNYKPDLIWSDGDWEMPDTYWGSQQFLAWLYNDSPVKDTVVVNDRWGAGDACQHGGYYTCQDRFNPGKLENHKWENALTIDSSSWGYNRLSTLSNYLTIQQLLYQLASTVSCGGNMLLNVGPTKDGLILPIFEERLTQIGSWLAINGEAIYRTSPWRAQNETNQLWYTSNPSLGGVYAIALTWPSNGKLVLNSPKASASSAATILGSPQIKLAVTPGSTGGLSIALPEDSVNPSLLASQWAWVFKLTNVA
jgi:alpha-L-fucosidase